MAVKMNLWSMTLLPGEKYPMLVRRDFQITNVALGEELRDENGRSVVKVTHNPIDPAAFDTDSEIDSDFDDSDDEFDMDGDDSVDEEVDDEEDDEEEADVEAKKKVKAVAKEALKARKDVDMDEDEDEDEDEEDDEEFDSDDEEALEVNVICSLLAGKVEQAQVNLTFVEGEVVMFEASGENAVHLLGNYIDQFPDVDSDSEFDSEEDDYDDYSALYDDEDDEDESGPEIEELEEEAEVEVKPKKSIKAAAAAPVKEEKAAATPAATGLKRKSDAVESPAGKTAEAAAASGEGLSKAQKKKLAKKAKLEGADAAPAPAAAAAAEKPKPKAQNAPQKRTTASGLIIEDITVGTGPVAKGGKRLGMRYIGKLTSGKQFDANTAGKPFSFVLGRGEVIKGWDEGLVGMAVGGERRLTIPPQLAYGKRASGPIPANSTLKFDVKLVSVN